MRQTSARNGLTKTVLAMMALVLTAMLSLCLAGCSSQPQEPRDQAEPASSQQSKQSSAEPEPLSIAESGYWINDGGLVHFAAIINNPNMQWAVEDLGINVLGLDENGDTVDTSSESTAMLLPNGKTAICGTAVLQGATKVDFQIKKSKNMWVKVDDIQQADYDALLYAEKIKKTDGKYDETSIAGQVVNKTENEYGFCSVNVVLRDANGKIVGGDMTYVDGVTSDSTVPFSLDIYDAPKFDTAEVYVDCGNLIQ